MVTNLRAYQWITPLLIFLFSSRSVAAVWWYEQAERLQHVSATLLDGPPVSEPVPRLPYAEIRMSTSLLPKVNPKVGSKEEKVPAAPVHAVPTIALGLPLPSWGRYTLVPTAWVGYLPLPQSVAKKIGVDASLRQFIAGGSIENVVQLPKVKLTTSIGGQQGTARLEGAITAAEAKDSFDAKTTLIYVSQGIQGARVPIWVNGMLIYRKVQSKFFISAEQTEFIREDKMDDATVPLAAQVTLGLTLKKSFHFAVSEYMVPNRLIMPRVSLAYQFAFSDNDEETAEKPNPESKVRKKRTRSSKPRN